MIYSVAHGANAAKETTGVPTDLSIFNQRSVTLRVEFTSIRLCPTDFPVNTGHDFQSDDEESFQNTEYSRILCPQAKM